MAVRPWWVSVAMAGECHVPVASSKFNPQQCTDLLRMKWLSRQGADQEPEHPEVLPAPLATNSAPPECGWEDIARYVQRAAR